MATRNKLSDRELANDKAKRIMNGMDAKYYEFTADEEEVFSAL